MFPQILQVALLMGFSKVQAGHTACKAKSAIRIKRLIQTAIPRHLVFAEYSERSNRTNRIDSKGVEGLGTGLGRAVTYQGAFGLLFGLL